MCFYCLWSCLVSHSRVSCRYGFVLFLLHLFLAAMVWSCFFMHFLPLWLYTISPFFTSAKSKFILIPLYKGIMDFLPYIRLGLLTHFAFSSLHLFTTLGWACWPFYFFFFSFSLFIYFAEPHLLGSILFLYLWVFLTLKEGPPITHLYFKHYSSRRASYYTTPKRGLWAYVWALFCFSKYSSFLGYYLDLICAFSSLWAFVI